MNDPKVPDFEWGPWDNKYTTDLFFNPKTGQIEKFRVVLDELAAQLPQREKLLPYWFGKVYTLRHQEGKAGCHVYFAFNKDSAVIQWGLWSEKAQDRWLTAVREQDTWCILGPEDAWEFGFDSFPPTLELYLNYRKINQW